MSLTVLYPIFDHSAVEERYASWQTQMLLQQNGSALEYYDSEERADRAAEIVDTEHVLVVTDPLLLPSTRLSERLLAVLDGASAAIPVSNEAADPRQRVVPAAPYVTLRELQSTVDSLESQPASVEKITWSDADPGVFLCTTEFLRGVGTPLRNALSGREVVLSRNDYVHRWSSMRGQVRGDLLERIDPNARSILEFGCGEGSLGATVKQRQHCRFVGIELDTKAAAVARRRIDDVYCGDVREVVAIVNEQFDFIIGGDIVEHLEEPWTFLADLRRLCAKGGRLLLSLPNVANVSIVNDLLRGRFDYVYMGLTCVGHLRFFTKRTIEDMLTIAGWSVVEIAPQPTILTPDASDLIKKLEAAGVPVSRDDLLSPGYYVTAENR
jgi:2-polyprenyl-3-methyl-5-hydroxy-6-metoxy-1,4-benzoquinol methylase